MNRSIANARIYSLAVALVIASLTSGCGGGGDSNPPAPQSPATAGGTSAAKKRIGAVLPMFSHPFFVAQKKGLEEKAAELGFEIDIRDGQDDDLKQISQVEFLIQKGVDLLILCPRDSEALVPAVEAANKAKIPVITLNRRVAGGEVICYVGADDRAGGVAQGEALEGPEDDAATVIHRIPAGLGEIVVAQILGRNVDGDQILRCAHAVHMRLPRRLFNPDGSSSQD